MHHHLYMKIVHIVEHLFGFAVKNPGIELEGGLLLVPSPRAKPRTQVDHCIYRDLFPAEGVDDGHHLLVVFQGSVGLHITQCPFGRHCSMSGYLCNILHESFRFMSVEDEEIKQARYHLVYGWDTFT